MVKPVIARLVKPLVVILPPTVRMVAVERTRPRCEEAPARANRVPVPQARVATVYAEAGDGGPGESDRARSRAMVALCATLVFWQVCVCVRVCWGGDVPVSPGFFQLRRPAGV